MEYLSINNTKQKGERVVGMMVCIMDRECRAGCVWSKVLPLSKAEKRKSRKIARAIVCIMGRE